MKVLASALVVLTLSHLAGAAEQLPKPTQALPDVTSGPPVAETPNFPFGYDTIQGNPPDSRIKRWIRYVIVGQHNHPFPIVFFAPQIFKPKTALESLIVLSDSEYKSLSAFTRTQPCTKQQLRPTSEQWKGGEITEHQGARTIHCELVQIDACGYLLSITRLPGVRWTPAQLKLIHGLRLETNCEAKKWESAP